MLENAIKSGIKENRIIKIKPNQNYKEKDFCFCHNCVKEHVYIAMSFLKEK